jgi:hypothetical protein
MRAVRATLAVPWTSRRRDRKPRMPEASSDMWELR